MSVERIPDPDHEPAEWEAFFDAVCAIDEVMKAAGLGRNHFDASEVHNLCLDLRQAVRHLLDQAFAAEEEDRDIYR